MFLRRIVEHLKTQSWTAVGLDLAIVILGVFLGTQVSNWNQERIEKRDTERLLLELRPALQAFADYFDTAKPYYATSRAYSDTAFAGWLGDPAVSDKQFVIAAYQASQVYSFGINGENWAAIFGGERLRDIDNEGLRRGLTNLMTFNYDQIDQIAVATPYRQHVRQVIPVEIQDAIRAECTDKPIRGSLLVLELPSTCDLDLPESAFAAGAAALRTEPELVGELRWHRAAVAAFLSNLAVMDRQTRQLQQAIDKTVKTGS
jgi:hypothetical protein